MTFTKNLAVLLESKQTRSVMKIVLRNIGFLIKIIIK